MQWKITVVVAMVVGINAVAAFFPFDDMPNMPKWKYMDALPLPTISNIPGRRPFPTLPTPPPLLVPSWFGNNKFPSLNFPRIPTVDEIKNFKPQNGGSYHGIAIESNFNGARDQDGNLINTGETSYVVNNNGVVSQGQLGNEAPNAQKP